MFFSDNSWPFTSWRLMVLKPILSSSDFSCGESFVVFNMNNHELDANVKEAMVSRLQQIYMLQFVPLQARILNRYHAQHHQLIAVLAKSSICFKANGAWLAWNTDTESRYMLNIVDL